MWNKRSWLSDKITKLLNKVIVSSKMKSTIGSLFTKSPQGWKYSQKQPITNSSDCKTNATIRVNKAKVSIAEPVVQRCRSSSFVCKRRGSFVSRRGGDPMSAACISGAALCSGGDLASQSISQPQLSPQTPRLPSRLFSLTDSNLSLFFSISHELALSERC